MWLWHISCYMCAAVCSVHFPLAAREQLASLSYPSTQPQLSSRLSCVLPASLSPPLQAGQKREAAQRAVPGVILCWWAALWLHTQLPPSRLPHLVNLSKNFASMVSISLCETNNTGQWVVLGNTVWIPKSDVKVSHISEAEQCCVMASNYT